VTDAAAGALRRVENTTASLALLAMVLLPIAEIVVRWFSAGGVPGSITLVQHLTLWVGFLGAALAARDGTLLALATATFLPAGRVRRSTELVAGAVAAAITALLAWGAIDLVRQSHEFNETIGPGIPKCPSTELRTGLAVEPLASSTGTLRRFLCLHRRGSAYKRLS
jgi:TRAP-type C4-dicarboxylate transport system permease small subunit